MRNKYTQQELNAPAYEPFRIKAQELAEAAGRSSMAEIGDAVRARQLTPADRVAIEELRLFMFRHPAYPMDVVFCSCGLPENCMYVIRKK